MNWTAKDGTYADAIADVQTWLVARVKAAVERRDWAIAAELLAVIGELGVMK
jgi:hypothetical protein